MNLPPTEKAGPQVDLKYTTPIVCEKCQSPSFFMEQTVLLRHVSALVNPKGQAGIMPIPVAFSCAACGHVNQQFLPSQLRDSKIVNPSALVT